MNSETSLKMTPVSRGDKIWTYDLCVPKTDRHQRRFAQPRKRVQPCVSLLIVYHHFASARNSFQYKSSTAMAVLVYCWWSWNERGLKLNWFAIKKR